MAPVGQDVLDLGELKGGPVILFGGAYSNLQALQEMLKLAKEEGVPPERIIHNGDSVAYCANPRETTELLRDSGVHCLMGNCEESIGQGSADCGCGFPEDSACAAYSVNWFAHVMKEFKGHDELGKWMGQLPRRINFSFHGRRFAVVHGSESHIAKFLWPSSADEDLREELPQDVDGVVCGHSGIPFMRLVPGDAGFFSGSCEKLWLNTGVIGMPANDGTSRGWFIVLTPQGENLEARTRALQFDHNAAAAAVKAAGNLNLGYADALLTGIWPSHDILPLDEQMASGRALEESTIVWKAASLSRPKSPLVALTSCPAAAIAVAAATALLFGWRSRCK